MRQIAVAILGSLLTAIYWWIVFTVVYASILFAGDRNPAGQPLSDREALTQNGITIFVGVLVYAALSIVWQRLTGRLRRTT